jgi:nucleoid-associated protein Lsr2
VTIDSSEPLADALRVIAALYDVDLAEVAPGAVQVAPEDGQTTSRRSSAAAAKTSQRRAAASTRSSSTRRGRSAQKRPVASSSEIRAWARENGYAVSDRGTLPASLKSAFFEAHRR